MRVLSVFGTRPEAVKMAPVVKQLESTEGLEARICVTAQHRQMLDQVLNLFAIQPDYDLDLMRENQSLAEMSAAIFTHLDPVFEDFKPDWVLVQGDTTTVATTSLLAYYRRIKVGHDPDCEQLPANRRQSHLLRSPDPRFLPRTMAGGRDCERPCGESPAEGG